MSNDLPSVMSKLLASKLERPGDTALCATLAAEYLQGCVLGHSHPEPYLLQMCIDTLRASHGHLLELIKATSQQASGSVDLTSGKGGLGNASS